MLLNTDAETHAQQQSELLALPTEILLLIYSYLIPPAVHLTLSSNKLNLATCVQEHNDGDASCASRNPQSPFYLSRLRSPWGPHWRCEESLELGKTNGEKEYGCLIFPMLLACKRMFIDVAQAIADSATVHITDVETLRFLHDQVSICSYSCLTAYIYEGPKVLHITWRLPFSGFGTKAEDNHVNSLACPMAINCQDLLNTIQFMKKLNILHLWLDHDDVQSWSVVNERAILSPLTPLWEMKAFTFTINLPKLHPKWETPSRHFTNPTVPSAFLIDRRYRQRVHCVRGFNDSHYPKYAPDFPQTFDLVDMEHATLEEVEAIERRGWLTGQNPYEEMRELIDLGVHWHLNI